MPSTTTLRSIALLAVVTQNVLTRERGGRGLRQDATGGVDPHPEGRQDRRNRRDPGTPDPRRPRPRGERYGGGGRACTSVSSPSSRASRSPRPRTPGNAKGVAPAKAALAKAEEKAKGPRREIDALLTRQGYPTVAELGEFPLESLSSPEIRSRFATGDQIAFVRDAWALLDRLEAAAKARGWEGGGDPAEELAGIAVGMGDLTKPLVGLKVSGETASALNDDDARINFRRLDSCWLIDGNEWIQK